MPLGIYYYEISYFKVIEDNQEQYVMGKSNLTLSLLNILFVTLFQTINKKWLF